MNRYFEIKFSSPYIKGIYAVIVEKPECIYIKSNDGKKAIVKLPNGNRGIHFCLRNCPEYTLKEVKVKLDTDPEYSDLKE